MRTPFAMGKLTSRSAEIVIVEGKEKAARSSAKPSPEGGPADAGTPSLLRALLQARALRPWESGVAH